MRLKFCISGKLNWCALIKKPLVLHMSYTSDQMYATEILAWKDSHTYINSRYLIMTQRNLLSIQIFPGSAHPVIKTKWQTAVFPFALTMSPVQTNIQNIQNHMDYDLFTKFIPSFIYYYNRIGWILQERNQDNESLIHRRRHHSGRQYFSFE